MLTFLFLILTIFAYSEAPQVITQDGDDIIILEDEDDDDDEDLEDPDENIRS